MFQTHTSAHGLSVTMNTDLTNVDKCIAQLELFLKKTHQHQHFFHLALLAREALNNAMIHGNKLGMDKKVFFQVQTENVAIILIVEDEGPGFDWHKHLDVVSTTEMENGRGHEIYRHFAQEVTYNTPGNILTLRYEG